MPQSARNPGSPAQWSPKPPPGSGLRAGGREGVRAAPRGDRGGGGGGGRWGRGGPLVAPGRCLSPCDPPLASSTWESWGHFERQHPVRWEAARPAVRGENPGRRSRGSNPGQQRIRFGPNATLRTWSAKRRLPDPHSSLIRTYPHPGTRSRSRSGRGQRWPRASGRASGAPPPSPGSS